MDYNILKFKAFLICHMGKCMSYYFYYILLNKRISVENYFKVTKMLAHRHFSEEKSEQLLNNT